MIIQRHSVWRPNIRVQRDAGHHIPSMLHVCWHKNLIYSSLIIIRVVTSLQALLNASLALSGQERLGLHQKQSVEVTGREARFCSDWQSEQQPEPRTRQPVASDGPGGGWDTEVGGSSGLSTLNQDKARPKMAGRHGLETSLSQLCLTVSASSEGERTQPSIFSSSLSLLAFPRALLPKAQPGLPFLSQVLPNAQTILLAGCSKAS